MYIRIILLPKGLRCPTVTQTPFNTNSTRVYCYQAWCSRRQEKELRKTEENIYDIKSRNQFYCIQDLKHTVPIASWPFG